MIVVVVVVVVVVVLLLLLITIIIITTTIIIIFLFFVSPFPKSEQKRSRTGFPYYHNNLILVSLSLFEYMTFKTVFVSVLY